MSCAVSIHRRYICIYVYMYILCDYLTILKRGCFACEVYVCWSIHLCLEAWSKVVPTLQESPVYLQACDHLATTLNPARRHDIQGLDNLLERLSQPCHSLVNNLVPTMPQPCSNLTTAFSGCYKADKCVPLVDLLNSLLWAGRNGLPPTSDT